MNAKRSLGSVVRWPAFALCLLGLAGAAAADDTKTNCTPSSADATCAAAKADTASKGASQTPPEQTPPEKTPPEKTAPEKTAPDEAAPEQPAPKESPAPAPPAAKGEQGESSRFSEEPIPLVKMPPRPRPPIELGEPFLGTGTLGKGFSVPGGAVWQPALLVWGSLRSGLHDVDEGDGTRNAAWVNRLDLNSQLSLTPTERVVATFRPFDEGGQFVGYTFDPVKRAEDDHFNATVQTLYFEGDFGELFPNLDPTDSHRLDYGFAVGRMPVFFEEGMLIDDALDGVGIVRNSLHPTSSWANLRLTGMFGWGQLNRGGNDALDPSAKLLGLFSEFDTPLSTVDVDVVYVNANAATGDGLYGGISSVQRIAGSLNSTFRALGSYALKDETASVANGVLLYSALSWAPRGTADIVYIDAYGAIKHYTPAGRSAGLGGPLNLVGILYEGVGLGAGYGSVLPNTAQDSFGGAIGYQKFLNHTRTQLIFELAGRKGTAAPDEQAQGAFAVRFQQALGRRLIARVEGFAHARQDEDLRYGGRCELLIKF
jgi:hypothetical protein